MSNHKTKTGILISKVGQMCGIGGVKCPKTDTQKKSRTKAGKFIRTAGKVVGTLAGLGALGLATGKIGGGRKSGSNSTTSPSGPLMNKPKMLMKKRKSYA